METTLDSMIDKAVATMLELPEEKLDSPSLLTTAIVNSIHCFSKINKLALAQRGKAFTEAKREEIGAELSKVLFYTSCISHLLDQDKSSFQNENVEAFAEDFADGYKEDVILCSLHAMQQLIDLSEMIFNPIDEVEFSEGEEEAVEQADLPEEIPTLQVDSIPEVDPSSFDLEFDENEAEQIVAAIFACVVLLCQRLALDYQTIQYNATTVEKFV